MEPYWNQIKQIVNESDIVLEVLDARAIEFSTNEQLEKIIAEAKRPRIYILNKADLISNKELEFVVNKFVSERKTDLDSVVYFSSKRRVCARNLLVKIRQIFKKHGKRSGFFVSPILERPYREAKGDIIVGVVGYPNVGKSSVINALSFKRKAKVASKAGTTHGIHWINASDDIKLIDTPGVIPLAKQDEAKLGIIAAKNPEKMKDPEVVAGKIVEMFLREGKRNRFEDFYKFKIKEENLDNTALILEQLAIEKKHLKKGGLPDDTRTSVVVIKDWQEGRLK